MSILTKLSRSIVVWATHALTRRPPGPVQRRPLALVAAPRHDDESHAISNTSDHTYPPRTPPELRLVWSDGAPVEHHDIPITGLESGVPVPAVPERRHPLAGAASFLAGQGARLYSLDAFRGARPGRTPHAA